jgi:hypothetical protein
MAIVNFEKFPVSNITGCDLILTPLFGRVGCGNHLLPGGVDVWSCASDGLISVTWGGQAYSWLTPDTFSPPSFGCITSCTPQLVVLVAWLHFGTDNAEQREMTAAAAPQRLAIIDASPDEDDTPD